MMRNLPVDEKNKVFVNMAVVRYLERLAKNLPRSILDNTWIPSPKPFDEVIY